MDKICYVNEVSNFAKISGCPIAYWMSNNFSQIFDNPLIYDFSISDGQNVTSDNARFVRCFWELNKNNIGKGKKWRYYAKGGGYRKWYGNIVDVVDWSSEAISFYHKNPSARVLPEYLWYKKGITWGLITSTAPSFRILPEIATFDKGGSSIFVIDENNYLYILALLNSILFSKVAIVLNPTLNFQVKDIRSMPLIIKNQALVDDLSLKNLELSKLEWDSFEISSDFKKHPLI